MPDLPTNLTVPTPADAARLAVAQELAEQRKLIHWLWAEVEALRLQFSPECDEHRFERSDREGTTPSVAESKPSRHQRTVRRSLLKTAGAGAAALVGAGLLSASEQVRGTTARVEAADNDPLTIGKANTGSTKTSLAATAGAGPDILLLVDNSGSTSTAAGSAGVEGVGPSNTNGVIGSSNGGVGYGVFGTTDQGYGVVGGSGSGIDLAALGTGRVFQYPQVAVGAPTAGSYLAGEQVRDANGDLYLCVASGTPGTWKKVLATPAGTTSGAMYLLSSPIRLLDTRPGTQAAVKPGTPIQGFTGFNLQVTGTAVGPVSVPAGAIAVIGNVTVVDPQSLGNLILYPAGGNPPNVSNINYVAGQVIANGVTIALNGSGQMSIYVNASGSTDVVFDASGYIL